jgi:3-oxoacyl-[acyl-carrier-protein] synthase-3
VARLFSFGSYLPDKVVTSETLACRLGCTADWIREMSGIDQRRFAADEESVVDMGVAAARDCLERAGVLPEQLGMIIVASGSGDRRFPGPACTIAARLGLKETPALDMPMASAGSLVGMSLASRLVGTYHRVLVIGTEKMSTLAIREPLDKNVAILFGDGAGACLITSGRGSLRIVDSALHTDGSFAEDLRLGYDGPFQMNGRSVITQAWRKIPAAISEVLERNHKLAAEVEIFLMHQANQNLIDRVARSLHVPSKKFFSNIARYGNTSSASMLIAAAEWFAHKDPAPGAAICFAAFGAGFNWGALLAVVGEP